MNAKPVTAPPEGRGDPFGLIGARLDSRYDVGDLVAQGGFGVVYRAQHRELRKPVAIKVLKTPSDLTPKQQADFLRRFTEEARTVAQLDHPHIVRVLDFGTSAMPSGAEAPWMALEWLEGVTLEADFDSRIVSGSGGRSPTECMALMYPVIEAVGMAHEEGIVHRDIKPGNLMIVTGRRGDQRLKLLDFGIAKVMIPEERRPANRAQTLTQTQVFSPDYAAPEQVSGMRTGPWTDVHALALLMSEMLTARVPFAGNDAMEMCSKVLSPRRPTPGRHGVAVGPWEAVFARALSLRPTDRYNNAGELLTALMNNLPNGVDINEALLMMSQTGAHRFTAAPSPPMPSPAVPQSLPLPNFATTEPPPSNPTIAEGINLLQGTSQPPAAMSPQTSLVSDPGSIPGVLAAPARTFPNTQERPSSESLRSDLPEFVIDSTLPEEGRALALYSAPTSTPSPRTPSFPPPLQRDTPTTFIAVPRSFVAPMIILIGLCFVGLVVAAVVLLIRPSASVVRPTNHLATAVSSPLVPVNPALPPGMPFVAARPLAPAVGPTADPPDATPGDSSRHRSRRHRTHLRSHRRHPAPAPTE